MKHDKLEVCINPNMVDIDNYVIRVREFLHSIPELHYAEHKTQAFILEQLRLLGFKPKKINTGIVCDIDGTDRKKRIALRADMDALPIIEQNDIGFCSKHTGVMHACGHDGHMAMLLGIAKLLREKEPSCNVRLIFQPAEENGGGAETMIENGVLDNVDMIFGLHLSPKFDTGTLALNDGALFAGACDYRIEMLGKSCHAALKNEYGDALKGANEYYNNIYQLFSESFSKKNLFHIGSLKSGQASNIVADNAVLECTFRFFDQVILDDFMLRQQEILNRIFKDMKVDHRLTVVNVYPPLINNASVSRLVLEKGGDNIRSCGYEFTAEDFAFYLQKVKGCFAWLGIKDEKHTSPLHSPSFNFDSKALMTGVEYFKKLIY